MKKLIYIISLGLLIISCKEEAPKDYVTLSGKITNQNSDSLLVSSRNYRKKIEVNPDGSFSDTLKVVAGKYTLYDGTESTYAYLKNGYDMRITLDTEDFDETVHYTGIGAEVSNYLASKSLMQEKVLMDDTMFILEKPNFEEKIKGVKKNFSQLLNNTPNTDSSFVSNENKGIDNFLQYVNNRYEDKLYWRTVLAKGTKSPKFNNYENHAGGTTSLDDFKGRYVFIDFWATWCNPCIAEIPYLKAIEKEYEDKNIAFVSISLDRESAYETWKKMVVSKELTGVQLYAKRDSVITDGYRLTTIPRFVLIDPDGNIVSSDAPNPSSDNLRTLFDELNL